MDEGQVNEHYEPAPGADELEEKARSRRRLVLLVTPIVVLVAGSFTATALTPTLSTQHPLLLIALDARNRNLILVSQEVGFVAFLLVATVRRMLSDPLFFLLGHYYGDSAVRWLEEKAGYGPLVRVTERFFSKASYPMVFVFPGAIVCAMAGATGMSFGWFLVLNVTGTITAVVVLRAFGDVLSGPVQVVLDFFRQYWWQTTLGTTLLVVLSVLLNHWQGKLEVPSIDELESELESGPAGDGDDAGPGG